MCGGNDIVGVEWHKCIDVESYYDSLVVEDIFNGKLNLIEKIIFNL